MKPFPKILWIIPWSISLCALIVVIVKVATIH